MLKFILMQFLFCVLVFMSSSTHAIESLGGFLVTAYDDRFKVVSPEKYKSPMEVIVENKTLVRLIGRVVVNGKVNAGFTSINPDSYQRVIVKYKKGDSLKFVPLSPAFQEVDLTIGNKIYEIPPKK